jgi:hypothetical protein
MESLEQRGYAVTVKQFQVRRDNWNGMLYAVGEETFLQLVSESIPSTSDEAPGVKANAAYVLDDPNIFILG